jgi:hypothetical protein
VVNLLKFPSRKFLYSFVQSFLRLKRFHLLGGLSEVQLLEAIRLLKPFSTNHNLIRIGGSGDGSYLIPDDLAGIDGCFSPGVSDLANFEIALLEMGIPCYLTDNSVDSPPIVHSNLFFEKKHLSAVNSGDTIRLDSWVSKYAPTSKDLILQMDIEGAEYISILSTPQEILTKFRIIVVEFHNLEHLTEKFASEIIQATVKKISTDYDVVHIHPNNARPLSPWGKLLIPPTLEVTFIRKDRVRNRRTTEGLPHELDEPNVADIADVRLPAYWWDGSINF